jgi:hypothetical protein
MLLESRVAVLQVLDLRRGGEVEADMLTPLREGGRIPEGFRLIHNGPPDDGERWAGNCGYALKK